MHERASLRFAPIAALLAIAGCRAAPSSTPHAPVGPVVTPAAAEPDLAQLAQRFGAGFVPPSKNEMAEARRDAHQLAQASTAHREAIALYDQRDYRGCAARLETSARLTGDGMEWYGAARCHALANHVDDAAGAFDHAIVAGFVDVALAEQDADLTTLRADARWPGMVARMKAPRSKHGGAVSAELARIYEEDQADRRAASIDWSIVSPRDHARRARVIELVAANALQSADDFWHAAMVFQHGDTPGDYELAHRLCLEALVRDRGHGDRGKHSARWLAAAAKDRWLQSLGKAQIYGTQYHRANTAAPWTMEPFDAGAVSDDERAWWRVPSVEESKARLAEMK